jgi:hypothetical protein
MPGISHRQQPFSINPSFAAAIHAVSFRPFDAFPLTLLDEPPLQCKHSA